MLAASLTMKSRQNNGYGPDDKRAFEKNPIKSSRCRLGVRIDGEKQNDKRAVGQKKRHATRAADLRKYSATAKLTRLSSVALVVTLLLGLNVISPVDGQQQQQQQQPQAQVQPRTVSKHSQPDSSSSMFADVEDMNDSAIKTRLGKITIEHLGDSPQDFDKLIERIVPGELESLNKASMQSMDANILQQRPQQQQQQQFKVYADANNKTIMHFFRNSKTFASIVYTNPFQDNRKQPRRLINCHLVDLEKHSSDVALYEAKYDIQTVDVEFKEMMQLIEACTNIVRLRRRPGGGSFLKALSHSQKQQLPVGINQQQQEQVQQLLAGDHLFAVPHGEAPASGKLASNTDSSNNNNQGAGQRPMLVAGRPLGSAVSPKVSLDQAQSLSTFQQATHGQLNQELRSMGPTIDDSNKLELAASSLPFDEMHNHPNANTNSNNNHQHNTHRHRKRTYSSYGSEARQSSHEYRGRFEPMRTPRQLVDSLNYFNRKSRGNYSNGYTKKAAEDNGREEGLEAASGQVATKRSESDISDALTAMYQSNVRALKRQLNNMPLVKTINRVNVATKKLVLGEVTAPPDTGAGRNGAGGSRGSVREAIQEISSYDTSDLLSIWRGILPGTNWCGMGDRATSYNDLGFESDIDICCRAHDFCPIRMSAFTSGYGLFNWSFYTRSHCWCDQNFLDCLQQAESPLSSVVMKFYFSIMKTTCLTDSETTDSGQSEQQVTPSNSGNGGASVLLGAFGPHGSRQQNEGAGSHNNTSGFLRIFEQAALGASKHKEHLQQQQQQQQSPLAIPALKHSQAFQNRFDG